MELRKSSDGVAGPLAGQDTEPAASAAIYHLAIERFRGIRTLSWYPVRGVNVILGGGDVGKTTLLEAIGLLLSPTNPSTLSDSDYQGRQLEAGFTIEAVVSLPPSSGINHQMKPSWPWEWDGRAAVVPSTQSDTPTASEAVYRLRVRGTPDLELVHEILQPDGTTDNLSVGLRRSIGLVRLGGDDRNDRDLRLVQGSALDRLLSDKSLRSRLARQLADTEVAKELTPNGQGALADLDRAFKQQSLPDGLDLAVTGGPGASIASMVGLTATAKGVKLPLATWGAGTRRLSALAIAEHNQGEAPITLVDEVERGLEPYRQRSLIARLQASASQVFLTTHSPSVIAAASEASFWYIDQAGSIGPLDPKKLGRHRESDPETFLSRLAIVAEGRTEVGFTSALLEKALGSPLTTFGVHVSDGAGHETTLELLEALSVGGLRFGGFADDEGKHPTRWQRMVAAQGPLLFRWASGRLEDNIISAVPEDKLEALITDPAGEKTGARLRTLAERLDLQEKDFASLVSKPAGELKQVLLKAALGEVPADKAGEAKKYRSHAHTWFKSVEGGRELAAKVFDLGLWQTLRPQLLPFCNAVRAAVDLPDVPDL